LKKVMLLAAMLAMVLAAAAPALAQSAVGGDTAVLQYSCDQIQAAVNTQYQQGEGVGAVAGAAQSMHVDQQQVLACFGQAAALQESTVNIGGGGSVSVIADTISPIATASAGGGGGGGGSASAAAGGALPDTGGASLIALGAGALLVAGGLLARRIVR
jgi:hypothetical protein